ncbi:hypothetical protein SS1G_08815 [Sclerotinia sclerotiorum 1980 UF-70]|uniref:Zn(2)-C6 fungal-type domain-containing protein n=1 Tax=Sclerotinia sclerotiorum (strain ATCC 18683 / 1980 / Ss-1) TaxID=665079 RepID=A7EU08_SCLS1|nr:hypothetical protein SS1G_08815 [Sclerotinia sclerotiorum 1980 UF-70]EDN92950.1 hypothetical protein SS1G_08815 [Sclerotinia sclerotiorum 1980 UF-70]
MADFVDQTASDVSGTASESTATKDNRDSNSGEKKVPPKASRQRFKPQLSCTFCRARKLKCDRSSPCNNCSRRDLSSSCTYIHNSREKTSQIQKTREKAKDVQERIKNLEDLVVALMNRTENTKATSAVLSGFQPSAIGPPELPWPDDTTISESADSIGRISVDDEMQNYVGGAHWMAILENIAGLKDSLGSEEWPQGTASRNNKYEGPELLLGDNTKASRESILACLPSKPLADNLVDRYFTAIDASLVITHAPTFKKESSCQVGLPRMINQGMYDTKPPSHILDEDFDENMVVLPPITTEYERSAIGHATFKYRLVLVFGKIFDASNLVSPISYDEVMRLEKLLLDAVEEIPECFRARSIHVLNSGSILQRVRRFSIEMTYLKSRCFLHRKFLSEAESLQKHSYSVKACVDSSMLILQYQNYMTIEAAQGRPLHGMKWITSSLMTYDFLLAATLLCLYLGHLMAIEGKSMHIRSLEFPIDWTKEDVLQALLKSYQIWNNPELSSEDTMKFSKVLKAMLNKVGHWPTADKIQAEASKEVANEANTGISPPQRREVLSANTPAKGCVPNHLLSNMYPLSPSNYEASPSESSTSNIGMIGDILSDPTGLDWSLWDSNFQGSNTYIDAGSSLYATDPYFPFQAAGFETNRERNQ